MNGGNLPLAQDALLFLIIHWILYTPSPTDDWIKAFIYPVIDHWGGGSQSALAQAWAYGDSLVKGGRGVDLPEILHILLALPEFSPLFCPNLGGQLLVVELGWAN